MWISVFATATHTLELNVAKPQPRAGAPLRATSDSELKRYGCETFLLKWYLEEKVLYKYYI